MKDNYLQVGQFPKAKLTIVDQVIPKDHSGSMKFKAILNLHGVDKEIEGTAELSQFNGKVLSIDAKIPVKLSDYKIAIPNYQGITVAEKVNIHFQSKALIN
ncbi:MAG: YceI family protein, partial [Pseudomonadota bacterium]